MNGGGSSSQSATFEALYHKPNTAEYIIFGLLYRYFSPRKLIQISVKIIIIQKNHLPPFFKT